MKLKSILKLLVIIFFPVLLNGQEVSFTASAPAEVANGQQFRLVYSINAEADNFVAPEITDFAVLAGPSQSSSSSIQIINNQVTRTLTITFSYTLAAFKEGTFTIPAARIRSGGKQLTSNPITIRVVAGAQQPGGAQQTPQGQTPPATGTISNRDVFLRASVDKTEPFQGEQVIVTYRLYTRIPVSNYNIEEAPSHTGFWAEELLSNQTRPLQYTDVVDGEQYTVAEIRKVALFPKQSGNLRIDPLQVEIVARVQQQMPPRRTGDPFFDSFFDDPFFASRIQNVNHTLQSNAININVKPLPAQNRPADFSGAVGDFTIQTTVDKTDIAANEPVNLKVVISGRGNVRFIDKLNFKFPPVFEDYDPKITTNVQANQSGVSGTRTLEYLLIPRSAGNFSINPAVFSYFNPAMNKYVSLKTPEFQFRVARGEGMDIVGGTATSDQQAIQYLSTDIRFIEQLPFRLNLIGSYFFGSTRFYMLYLSPLVLFGLFVVLWRNHIRNSRDLVRVKNRRATRIARRRLYQASEFLKMRINEKFFNELSQAIWGYLGDKFNIPLAELSLDTVRDRLASRHVNPDIIDDCIKVLEQCEYARFAPGDKTQTMNLLYEQGLGLITRIEKDLR